LKPEADHFGDSMDLGNGVHISSHDFSIDEDDTRLGSSSSSGMFGYGSAAFSIEPLPFPLPPIVQASFSAANSYPRSTSSSDSGDVSDYESEASDNPDQELAAADAVDDAEEDRRDTLSTSSRQAVHAKLRTTLITSNLEPSKLKACLEMLDDLQDKANKPKGLRKKHPRTYNEIMGRLRGQEEEKHPWGISIDVPSELWRCWDEISRAQNRNNKVGFLSGGADWKWGLTTRRGRRRALARHSNSLHLDIIKLERDLSRPR
jgi:hypothetical protein